MEAPAKQKIDTLRTDITSKSQGLLASVKDLLEESKVKETEAKRLGTTAELMKMSILKLGSEGLIEQLEQIVQQVRTLNNI